MDDPNDVGAAFTGQSAMAPIEPAQAAGQWDDFLQRPGNRQALLQMGLQLMQPMAQGQTVAGQIGQAIGAGGEAVDRNEASDLAEKKVSNNLELANERLRIAQQNADSNATRTTAAASLAAARAANLGSKKVGGLTDLMKARFARQDAQSFEKQLDADAKAIVKQANDVLATPDDPVTKQYKGKTQAEVREMLRATRPKPKYGAVPSNEDDSGDSTGGDVTTEDTGDAAPPYPGARLAADGNWYVQKDGKTFRVKQ